MDYSLIPMSFFVGIMIGLTSMGGAALMAPFLILVVGVRPVTAVGTDLVYGAITKIFGACVHLKQGTVDLAVVRKLATGSLPAGLAGAAVVVLLPHATHNADLYVRRAIGGILVVVALVVAAHVLVQMPDGLGLSPKVLQFLQQRGTVLWGAVVGFCVGATSVGSGSMLAPFLMLLYPSKTAKVVGTDVFHAAILISVTALPHIAGNGVEWNLVPLLLAGSIPGVILGSKLAVLIPARPLRTGLAAVLFVSGYQML